MRLGSKVAILVFFGGYFTAAFFLGRKWLFTPAASNIEAMEVVVAKADIDRGAVLEDDVFDDLVTKYQYSVGDHLANAVSNIEDLRGKRARRTIHKGERISADDFGPEFELPVPMGTSKYKIKSVRGFWGIQPGDHVKIVATELLPNRKTISTSLFRHVLVLHVLDRVFSDSYLTLAVTEAQRAVLDAKQKEAEIRFVPEVSSDGSQ